jgi:hypothetical protein
MGLVILIIAILSGRRNPLENDARIGFALLRVVIGFFVSLAMTYYGALALGVFNVSPIESRGLGAIPELIGALALLALKGLVCVLLPAILLSIFLSKIGSLAARIVLYIAFGTVAVGSWYTHHQQVKQATETAARAEREQQRERDFERQQTELATQARIDSDRREVERRTNLLDRIVKLQDQARKRWREDLEAAGAIGEPGEAPPFLDLRDNGAQGLALTNLSSGRVCVKVVRIHASPNSRYVERCQFDVNAPCSDVYSTRSLRLTRLGRGTSQSCDSLNLEYRIGDPRSQGLSWWSRSALQEFDLTAPEPREFYQQLPEVQLLGEVSILEKSLAEPDRAARWRRELESSSR